MEMTGSPGGEDPGRRRQRSAGKPRRRWGGLRQRWKMLGVFEIDQSHAFYGLTCMMKEGLSAAVQNTIDNPPTNELSDDDYRSEMIKIHQEFQMKTFAGKVFANLRSSLGITESAYQESLCSEACYLQFISNSKSKADFFLTNDKRFFLKTQNKREIHFLLDHLHVYVEHLRNYPHSLLVKFLGVHRMTINRQQKYFIVMQSVFYPDERINTRYDIKGCELSRWTEPAPEGSQVIVVLKDLNFKGNGQQIVLDQQRAWLLRQVEIDTQFLQSLNVLDYSLLLAQQPLHQDEKLAPLSLATLIVRTKKSVNPGSPIHAGATGEDPSAPPRLSAETDSFCLSRTSDGGGGGGGDPPPPSLEDFRAQNRRLLPNFKNPLHVIDGPEQRYFVGIIDIFTVYGFRKRLEHWWKRLRHPGQSFSTVSPPAYCLRLCQWTRDNTA